MAGMQWQGCNGRDAMAGMHLPEQAQLHAVN